MKLMFNETGGQKCCIGEWTCKSCMFRQSKLCIFFHKWCGSGIYRETSLDIFKL
jgi:hypothetical protein